MDNIGPAQAEFNTRVEKLSSLIIEKLEVQLASSKDLPAIVTVGTEAKIEDKREASTHPSFNSVGSIRQSTLNLSFSSRK